MAVTPPRGGPAKPPRSGFSNTTRTTSADSSIGCAALVPVPSCWSRVRYEGPPCAIVVAYRRASMPRAKFSDHMGGLCGWFDLDRTSITCRFPTARTSQMPQLKRASHFGFLDAACSSCKASETRRALHGVKVELRRQVIRQHCAEHYRSEPPPVICGQSQNIAEQQVSRIHKDWFVGGRASASTRVPSHKVRDPRKC